MSRTQGLNRIGFHSRKGWMEPRLSPHGGEPIQTSVPLSFSSRTPLSRLDLRLDTDSSSRQGASSSRGGVRPRISRSLLLFPAPSGSLTVHSDPRRSISTASLSLDPIRWIASQARKRAVPAGVVPFLPHLLSCAGRRERGGAPVDA